MASDTPAAWAALFAALGGRAELASLCRVSESTIYRWSRGDAAPSAATISYVNHLCESHGVSRVFTPAAPEKKASNA